MFEKNFVERFEERGYRYTYRGANHFELESNSRMILASFDVPKMMPHCIRVMLSQIYLNHWRHFVPSEFRLESPVRDEVYFYSEEEFLQNVNMLVSDTLHCLLLLEQNKRLLVEPKDCYNMSLSEQTIEKASEFAQQNHLRLSESDLAPWAMQWLQDHYINKSAFSTLYETLEADLPMFLSFCAYCGEVFRQDRGGTWRWYQDDFGKGYVILWKDGGINVLGEVTEYLSYCSILQNQNLFAHNKYH